MFARIHKITDALIGLFRRIRPNKNVRRSAIKVYRRFSSLHLPLKTQKKHAEIEMQVLNALLYAAADNTSINQVARDVVDLDSDTLMYHLHRLTVDDVAKMNQHLEQIFLELRRNKKLPRKLRLAIDSTDYKFYGKYRNAYVIHYKSDYVFRYIMVSVVAHRVMYPLMILPVSQLSDTVELVERLITVVKRFRIRVKSMYFDRGFYAVDIVRLLKKHKIPFVIGAEKSRGVKRVLSALTEGDTELHEFDYTMRSDRGAEDVVLYVRWNRRKEQWFTAIGWRVRAEDVRKYMHRWGIETEFRMIKEVRIKTTTRNAVIRYMLVMISALICALYAALRLGEVVMYIEAHIVLENEEAVTLYRVCRAIKTVLDGGENAVL